MSWMSPSYIHMEGLNTSRTPLASKYKLFLYREVGWDGDQTVSSTRRKEVLSSTFPSFC